LFLNLAIFPGFSVRFHATLGVACTFALVQLLLAGLLRQRVPLYHPLSWIALSSFKWNKLFGLYLSRKLRALFDEMNILETYQPRAWTMGHLFEPEPPTPCPGTQNNNTAEADKFRALRDAVRMQHFL
uniref:ABC2_membrane_7 domain-containing protein n=1 Tax=Angiostrongylus cantonensis TaxID=6313 RepID=A0A0K0DB76_ANGCA